MVETITRAAVAGMRRVDEPSPPHLPADRTLMPDDRSAATLIREVGLIADGPVPWGRPVRHGHPGVFVVELPAPAATPGLDLSLIGKWLERVPDLGLDGTRPVSKELQARLGRVLAAVAARAVRGLDAGRWPDAWRRSRRPSPATGSLPRRVLAPLPPVPGRPPGVVGRDRRARGVRGRAAGRVRGRRAGRRAWRAARPVDRHAVGGAPLPVRPAQAHGHHQPAAARGQGAGAAARHADRRPAARRGRRCPRRGEAGPPPGARPRRGPDRVGRRIRRPGLAAQGRRRAGPALARGARTPGGGARRARRPAARRHPADRHGPRARRPQGERRVPRRARGAGVPRGADQAARGEAQGTRSSSRRPSAARSWASARGCGSRRAARSRCSRSSRRPRRTSREGRISTRVAGRGRAHGPQGRRRRDDHHARRRRSGTRSSRSPDGGGRR